MADGIVRGRPQVSSREMLQEAAFELFLENGYAGTTVDQIAQRAGVSRNTFFNYFPSKSGVFWIDLDAAMEALGVELDHAGAGASPMVSVRNALVAVAGQFGPQQVPWALTQHDMVGDGPELYSAALSRLASHVKVIADFLAARDERSFPPMMAHAAAWAVVGATVAAVQSWAAAGTSREDLATYVSTALEPACRGFDGA